MKKVNSNISEFIGRTGKLFHDNHGPVDCDGAQELMSPFIDSMATPEEVSRLELHLNECEPCQRQLQSFISVRSLLTRMEQPKPPEDMVLQTRVRLSQARNSNVLERLENRLSNALRPIAIPAVGGVCVTMLFFGILLGATLSNTTVVAHAESVMDRTSAGLYSPVRTTNLTMLRFAGSDTEGLEEPLMIETHVGDTGKVLDYKIISGPDTPEVKRWIREQLSLATFTPASAFGRPVDSKIILSFVAVKS